MDRSRGTRVGQMIQQELMRIIQREMHDPRVGFATVTEVRMSPDLRTAKVFVSVLGDEAAQKESFAAIEHAAGFLRSQVSHCLSLRHAPELRFVLDKSTERAIRIEQLLHESDNKEES